MSNPHYATRLKLRIARLEAALEVATDALRTIPQSRFDKYANCGQSEHSMAYRKAVGEIALRNREAVTRTNDILTGEEDTHTLAIRRNPHRLEC